MGQKLSGIKVLLAEDDEFNLMIARDELEWYIPRVDLTLARNGKTAFEMWNEGNYDLLITDIQMPEMNGYELTHQIRKAEKNQPDKNHTPILAMTASVLNKDIEKCLAAGMDNYIPKPFQSHEFVTVIYGVVSRN